jgi:hypothetical protein
MKTEAQLKRLASLSNVGQKAVERLLGSIEVQLNRETEAESPKQASSELPRAEQHSAEQHRADKQSVQLGLNVRSVFLKGELNYSGDAAVNQMAKLLREYAGSCPQIVAWIGRGDFKASKIPDELSRAKIIHACRTAGRLRAGFMRGASRFKAT